MLINEIKNTKYMDIKYMTLLFHCIFREGRGNKINKKTSEKNKI